MLRSCATMIVCVALLGAMAVPPLLHLHVAQSEHHHDAHEATHEHHALVHAHGSAHEHQRAPMQPSNVTELDIRSHTHGRVVSLDTLQTELPFAARVVTGVETATSMSAPDRVAGRHVLSEPRSHAPPGLLSSRGRAPPA